MNLPEHLASSHSDGTCRNPRCSEAVKREAGAYGHSRSLDGWFITIGHPGFNSLTNNSRNGYRTQSAARAAIRRFAGGR